MRIESYKSEYKDEFIAMNKAWIEDMFTLEKEDLIVLGSIEERLTKGGQIFFAINDNDDIMACCMIVPISTGEWEIEKFAAKTEFAGSGAGSACLSACIDYARSQSVKKILIVTNRKCEAAIHLYRKFGFIEIPFDKKKFPYKRADISFEQVL